MITLQWTIDWYYQMNVDNSVSCPWPWRISRDDTRAKNVLWRINVRYPVRKQRLLNLLDCEEWPAYYLVYQILFDKKILGFSCKCSSFHSTLSFHTEGQIKGYFVLCFHIYEWICAALLVYVLISTAGAKSTFN